MVCDVVGDEPISPNSDDIKFAWQKLSISSVRKAIEELRGRVQCVLDFAGDIASGHSLRNDETTREQTGRTAVPIEA
nr:unnamed protein product [Haemonchus contortus]